MNSINMERSVVMSPDAPKEVRSSLGLTPSDSLRIAFFGGPGDVIGTFERWRSGKHDSRNPVIAYSEMFFSLAHELQADALILSEKGPPLDASHQGFTFVHAPRRRPRGRLAYFLDERAFAIRALDVLNNFRPNIVIAGGDVPNFLIQSLHADTRVILTIHNCFWAMGKRPLGFRARMKQMVKGRAFRRIYGAICTSEECARQAISLGVPMDRCKVEIPQVLRRYTSQADTAQPRQGPARRLVFLGRIEPEKGVFDLLAAFQELAAKYPDLTLHIAGIGSASSALAQIVAQGPFSDRITLHGLLGANEVHALLESSDLLVCPTQDTANFFEGLALVVVEAAVHGVPSVVSSVVPAQDLFPGACAIFPPCDRDALAKTLDELVGESVSYKLMSKKLYDSNERFFDRSLSWGSALYRLMI